MPNSPKQLVYTEPAISVPNRAQRRQKRQKLPPHADRRLIRGMIQEKLGKR